jgi:hypothetical protein
MTSSAGRFIETYSSDAQIQKPRRMTRNAQVGSRRAKVIGDMRCADLQASGRKAQKSAEIRSCSDPDGVE